MKRKLGRWLIGALLAVVLVFVLFILSLDTIAKFVAERRIRSETGMETKIGKFTIGLKTSTIHIQNFVLKNPAEFGGGSFVEIPELFLDYDREALRSGKLHLNLVRIEVAKIHLVENKDGKRNDAELQKRQHLHKRKHDKDKNDQPFDFDGLEKLDVTLGTVQFTSFKNPAQNLKQDLGIQHEIFKNLKTEKDFQTAAALLTLKAGTALLMGGEIANPVTFLFGNPASKQESEKILQKISEPPPESNSTNVINATNTP